MEFKPGTPLRADQARNPITTLGTVEMPLPDVEADFFIRLFGPGRSKRIKTWGHLGGPLSAHYLATRGGTPLHTDPAYARFSVQMQLHNEGFYTHGLDEDPEAYPVLRPGVVVLLDTHSPHKVAPDPRLEQTGLHKMSVAIDYKDAPDPEEAIGKLIARILHAPPEVP